MVKLSTPRSYALITGVILFLIGFCGFAFPNIISLPGGYLFAALVLGFWGIVVGVNNKQ
jgi:uncharacterized membrane protein YiaA